MKSPYTGLQRIIHAFKYSFEGLFAAFKSETAFKQDILLCLFAVVALFFINVSLLNKILLALSLVFIILAELINTAIETIVDRISPEKHHLSKKAKDIGSAIVMLTILSVAVLWVAVIIFA